MILQLSPNVEQLIRNKMATGRYGSEEEMLVKAVQSPDDSDEEIQACEDSIAIEEGVSSLDRGEAGVSLDESFARLRSSRRIDC